LLSLRACFERHWLGNQVDGVILLRECVNCGVLRVVRTSIQRQSIVTEMLVESLRVVKVW